MCVHHCPFWHTCGIYPHYPQKTSLATTSNDELCQEEDKIAQPFVEEVHWAVHCCFSLLAGTSLLMRHLGQVRDTLQVPWHALSKMSRSAMRKSEVPPKYRVASHCAIVQKQRCDPQCLPTLTRNMLTAICEPCMLQKHPARCTSPPGSSDVLGLPQSTRDQWGVHSPSVSRRVVFDWRVSILTTAWPSMALQSESSSVLHPVEFLHLSSELHASNSSQRNTMPQHHACPSQYHPLDRQTHLVTATLSENTSHRVNGIPV